MSASRCSRFNGSADASTSSSYAMVSAGPRRSGGVYVNSSAILPADTISRILASLKVLRRVTASTTAPSVAGALASNCMNLLINYTCLHIHFITIRRLLVSHLATCIQCAGQHFRNRFVYKKEAPVVGPAHRRRQSRAARQMKESAMTVQVH